MADPTNRYRDQLKRAAYETALIAAKTFVECEEPYDGDEVAFIAFCVQNSGFGSSGPHYHMDRRDLLDVSRKALRVIRERKEE
jgi:hypothetical protein